MMNMRNLGSSNNNSTKNITNKDIDDNIIQQFKIIMFIVLIALLGFLGFFVYNLIKCYLPKWKREREMREGGTNVDIQNYTNEGVQIEFADK
jgi:hypothetical protein